MSRSYHPKIGRSIHCRHIVSMEGLSSSVLKFWCVPQNRQAGLRAGISEEDTARLVRVTARFATTYFCYALPQPPTPNHNLVTINLVQVKMIRLSAFVTLAAALSTASAFVPTPPPLGRASAIAQQQTAPRTSSLDGESAGSAEQGTEHSYIGEVK